MDQILHPTRPPAEQRPLLKQPRPPDDRGFRPSPAKLVRRYHTPAHSSRDGQPSDEKGVDATDQATPLPFSPVAEKASAESSTDRRLRWLEEEVLRLRKKESDTSRMEHRLDELERRLATKEQAGGTIGEERIRHLEERMKQQPQFVEGALAELRNRLSSAEARLQATEGLRRELSAQSRQSLAHLAHRLRDVEESVGNLEERPVPREDGLRPRIEAVEAALYHYQQRQPGDEIDKDTDMDAGGGFDWPVRPHNRPASSSSASAGGTGVDGAILEGLQAAIRDEMEDLREQMADWTAHHKSLRQRCESEREAREAAVARLHAALDSQVTALSDQLRVWRRDRDERVESVAEMTSQSLVQVQDLFAKASNMAQQASEEAAAALRAVAAVSVQARSKAEKDSAERLFASLERSLVGEVSARARADNTLGDAILALQKNMFTRTRRVQHTARRWASQLVHALRGWRAGLVDRGLLPEEAPLPDLLRHRSSSVSSRQPERGDGAAPPTARLDEAADQVVDEGHEEDDENGIGIDEDEDLDAADGEAEERRELDQLVARHRFIHGPFGSQSTMRTETSNETLSRLEACENAILDLRSYLGAAYDGQYRRKMRPQLGRLRTYASSSSADLPAVSPQGGDRTEEQPSPSTPTLRPRPSFGGQSTDSSVDMQNDMQRQVDMLRLQLERVMQSRDRKPGRRISSGSHGSPPPDGMMSPSRRHSQPAASSPSGAARLPPTHPQPPLRSYMSRLGSWSVMSEGGQTTETGGRWPADRGSPSNRARLWRQQGRNGLGLGLGADHHAVEEASREFDDEDQVEQYDPFQPLNREPTEDDGVVEVVDNLSPSSVDPGNRR